MSSPSSRTSLDRRSAALKFLSAEYDGQGGETNLNFHHDHLRSVTGLSGHDGEAIEQITYSPFGAVHNQTGTPATELLYTGRENDAETGLYYYRARYYDPLVGRFISEDPLGFKAGVNFYAYVGNSPLDVSDPLGLHDNLFAYDTGSTTLTGSEVADAFAGKFPDLFPFGGAIVVRGDAKHPFTVGNILRLVGGNYVKVMDSGRMTNGSFVTLQTTENLLLKGTATHGVVVQNGRLIYQEIGKPHPGFDCFVFLVCFS